MSWLIPTEYINPVIAIPAITSRPYLKPYVAQILEPVSGGELSGIFDDIWSGIKQGTSYIYNFAKDNQALVIPTVAVGGGMFLSKDIRKNTKYVLPALGIYSLGYYLTKYKSNPKQVIEDGSQQIATDLSAATGYNVPSEYYELLTPIKGGQTPLSMFSTSTLTQPSTSISTSAGLTSTSFWHDLLSEAAKFGVSMAALKMQEKVNKDLANQAQRSQTASRQPGSTVQPTTADQIVEQTMAYVSNHAQELSAMGFKSMEEAVTAILYATGGQAPPPNVPPSQLLSQRGGRTAGGYTSNLKELLSKYWWVGAGAAGLIWMSKKGK